ncbi:unnamed protein product [Polarella glacialis]|uniref:Uncharacterized protein n=1 Tax=Polarella glacialis TaxID=89957 RepID=A0A813JQX1_POLGL|nr:unnamed protein product [Polarella glacialis]
MAFFFRDRSQMPRKRKASKVKSFLLRKRKSRRYTEIDTQRVRHTVASVATVAVSASSVSRRWKKLHAGHKMGPQGQKRVSRAAAPVTATLIIEEEEEVEASQPHGKSTVRDSGPP